MKADQELIEQIKKMYGRLPKVLVGCPVNIRKDYIIDRYIDRLKNLTYPNYEIVLADNSKSHDFKEHIESQGVKVLKCEWYEGSRARICESRNALRLETLNGEFDFYMSIECDVIPREDIIEQLLKWNKPIVGGWYYIGEPLHARPCISDEWKDIDGFKIAQEPPAHVKMGRNKLMKVFLGSMGIMLIHREVLEKIKFKVYEQFPHHDDSWFFFDIENLGYEVWIDTDLLVPHFQAHKQWENVTR